MINGSFEKKKQKKSKKKKKKKKKKNKKKKKKKKKKKTGLLIFHIECIYCLTFHDATQISFQGT